MNLNSDSKACIKVCRENILLIEIFAVPFIFLFILNNFRFSSLLKEIREATSLLKLTLLKLKIAF